jgi:HKD family nuclease
VINAITGLDDHLLPHLEAAIDRADKIRFIVAFVMESGVKLILPHLKQAARRGVPIQLLTGQYLSITEPSALYLLYNWLARSFSTMTLSFDMLQNIHSGKSLIPFAMNL